MGTQGGERREALRKLEHFHERKPDLFTAPFIVECWNRMWFEYTECVREGVRTLVRMLPEGTSREALATLALSPHRKTGARVWRWPNVFSFKSKSGMWKGRILPEMEERLETARINGSTLNRIPPNAGGIPSNFIRLTKKEKVALKRQQRTLTGGIQKFPGNATEIPKGAPLIGSQPTTDKPLFPQGKKLRGGEYDASKAHAPRDGATGRPICWNFNANCGCAVRGGECENGLHRMLKRNGLHWAVHAQMARRGGFKGTPLLTPEATDGYIQSLRDAEQKALAQKIDDGHTG